MLNRFSGEKNLIQWSQRALFVAYYFIIGARFGVNNIPKQWKDTVLKATLDRHKTFPDVCCSDISNLVDNLLSRVTL